MGIVIQADFIRGSSGIGNVQKRKRRKRLELYGKRRSRSSGRFCQFFQNVKDVIKYKSVWVFGAVMFGTYGV